MSIATFVAYGIDKVAARRGVRRTRERTLHLLAFAGGWPGAFAAQLVFRHKCSKAPFQATFWGTVGVHCFAVYAGLRWLHA